MSLLLHLSFLFDLDGVVFGAESWLEAAVVEVDDDEDRAPVPDKRCQGVVVDQSKTEALLDVVQVTHCHCFFYKPGNDPLIRDPSEDIGHAKEDQCHP